MKLTMEEATRMIVAAEAASREGSVSSAIAVVDQGGHLLAFARSENALLATIEVAQVKARTAVYFGTDTKNLPFDKPFTPALLGAVSQPLELAEGRRTRTTGSPPLASAQSTSKFRKAYAWKYQTGGRRSIRLTSRSSS